MNKHHILNRVLRTFAVALIILSFQACSSALEEETKNIHVADFYKTENELQAGLNAIFTPLYGDPNMGGFYHVLQEALSDFFIPNGSWIPLGTYTVLDNTNYGRTGVFWDQFYLSIRNANLIVSKAPESEGTDKRKDEIMATARFMRGLLYFQLVKGWGAVPLRTEQNLDEIHLEKSTPEDVYRFILDDLAFAEQNLSTISEKSGLPNSWAAKTVMADVYLWMKKYPEARDKAKEVIDKGPYSLVQVSAPDDFLKLYGPDVDQSSEEIFYLKFARQTGFGNGLTLFEAHPNTPYANRKGLFSLYTRPGTIKAFRDWDDTDLRKQFNAYPWTFGSGEDTHLIKKFQDINAMADGRGGNDYPWYKYSDLLMIYAEADNEVNNGPTVESIEMMNQIKRRAYGKTIQTAWVNDYKLNELSKSSFLTAILKERGYETLFEGKRWRDLVRLGKAESYINDSKGIAKIANLLYLWPIPNSELFYNEKLDPLSDQNPGY